MILKAHTENGLWSEKCNIWCLYIFSYSWGSLHSTRPLSRGTQTLSRFYWRTEPALIRLAWWDLPIAAWSLLSCPMLVSLRRRLLALLSWPFVVCQFLTIIVFYHPVLFFFLFFSLFLSPVLPSVTLPHPPSNASSWPLMPHSFPHCPIASSRALRLCRMGSRRWPLQSV